VSDNTPAGESLKFVKINHINAIVDGYASAIDHFVGRLGFQLNLEIPAQGDDVDACLVTIGGVMFEFFAPRRRADRGQGRLLALYGDHYIGIEYQVAEVDAARATCAALGIRLLLDRGEVLFTHPRDGFGVSWELWEGDWHGPRPDFSRFVPIRSAEQWRQHPLGVTGLSCLRANVADVRVAADLYATALGATELYDERRPAITGRAIGMRLADTVIELIGPSGDGAVTDFLDRYGPRLRSTVFTVGDLDQAVRHLEGIGVATRQGDDDASVLLAPEHNHGLRFELTERALA
jgi:hypothetical protein